MKSTTEYINILRDYMAKNASKYSITRMGIFGSVARGEQTEDSDVDVYLETSKPSMFALVHIKELNLDGMNTVFIPWFNDYWMLQFLPYGAAKGKAVMELANQLGMDSSQVMSFGDSYNDMEMIKESGIGIVMGNACEALKEVADYITLSNDEDGVAVILEKMATG